MKNHISTLLVVAVSLASRLPAFAIGFGPTITELHYHPRDDETQSLEFVEIYNQDPTPFDLSGYYFSSGISYEIPQGTLLPGRAYLVVAADPDAMKLRAPIGARIFGGFSGRLDSGGEKLALANPGGVPVVEIDYDNDGRWPHGADGTGFTLAKRSVHLDPGESESWTVSAQRDGTPGRPNFPAGAPEPAALLSELFAPSTGARWLEIANAGDAAIDLAGFRLSPSPLLADAYELPAGPSIPPGGFLVVPESALPFSLAPEPGAKLSLFLATADEKKRVDAYAFPPAASETASVARLPGGIDRWSAAADPTPGAPNRALVEGRIVLNEIQYHPHPASAVVAGVPDRSLEFIELFNRSAESVDLGGFAFTKGIRFAMPPGTLLAGGGYLVIAADPEALARVHGIQGMLGPWEGTLSDRGERLVLEDPAGNIADEVHYLTGGEWPQWADGGGSSLELIDPTQDRLQGGAWSASDEGRKAPWKQLSYPGRAIGGESELHLILQHRGTVMLDDIQIESVGGTRYIPNGSFDANADGWVFEGTHVQSHRTQEEAFSGAGCLELTSSGRGDSRVNKIEVDTVPALPLGATLTISYAARWVRGSNILTTRGSSHGLARTMDLPVPQATGTPGARNSTAVENLAPVISGAHQVPAVPQPLEPVAVEAVVTDPDGVLSATLHFKKDIAADAFVSAPMLDDGIAADRHAADGVFTASIPGFSINTRVRFYVEAADAKGAVRIYPEDAPTGALLYQIQTRGISTPAHLYRVILGSAETQTLQARKALSNDLVPGTFIFGDQEIYYNVGVRYRGSPWLRPAGQKSYRVRLEKDAPFRGAGKINLDMTGVSLNERAAFYMIRQASEGLKLPYSLQAHVRLLVNGNLAGLYEHVQQVDKSYVEHWYPGDDQGDLLKTDIRMDIDDGYNTANVRNLALDFLGNDEEQYRYNFSPRTNEALDSFASLIALCRGVDPDVIAETAFRRDLEKLVDVEELVHVLGMRLLDDDWDTFGIGAKNAYFYHAPVEGRWKLIPWDSDNTFGNINATLWPNDFYREMVRIFNVPKYRRFYLRFIDTLTKGPFTSRALGAYLNPTRNAMQTEGVGDPSGIYNFVTGRANVARALLPAPAQLKVTSPNPMSVATEAATLTGTAPLNVAIFVVGGEVLEPSWVQIQTWRLEVPVHPGDNEIELLAFDDQGHLAGSVIVQIHSSAVWDLPSIETVAPSEGPAEGGNEVLITGSGIRLGATAFFGGVPALESIVVSSEPPGPPQITGVRARVPRGVGTVAVSVRNVDGNESALPAAYLYIARDPPFRRGELNGDGRVDISDAIALLGHLFNGPPIRCDDAADVNDDGKVDISDAIRLLHHLYLGAPAPPAPFDAPGEDPTLDLLGCAHAE